MLLGDALNRSAQVYPHKVAVVDLFGKYVPIGLSYTYEELRDKANRLANGLLSLGLEKGDRVAVLSQARIPFVVSLLAVVRAGLVFTPLNPFFVGRELAYQVNDCGAKALIMDADQEGKVREVRSQLGSVQHLVGIGEGHGCFHRYEALISDSPSHQPEVTIGEEDLATLLYTSGTTGLPKGAMLTHRNWSCSAYLFSAETRFLPHWKFLGVLPHYSSGGVGLSLITVFRGATQIWSDFEPQKVLKIIQEHKINFTMFAPTMTARLVNQPDIGEYDLSSLKGIITSAAPIAPELLKKASAIFGDVFVIPFGTTETALMGLILQPEERALEGPLSERLTSVGKTMMGYEARVVDGDGNDVGPGGVGELIIRGDPVAKGYWNRPEAPDFKDGWWYSGDLARVDQDGYVHIVDRKKDMILSGGVNIYPREIEDVLLSHPGVFLAAVIGVPDEEWGESVKAVIVPKEGAKVTEEEILEFCGERLASYKKPRSVDIVSISQVPLMGGGYKVVKRELRERYRQKYMEEKGKRVERWGEVEG
jgi:long-chain acyl-CoA synthetase